ncbi:hypothetical protein [Methanobrevibacter arboriphilus]|uniref:Uncharacterized protein n=1 Tax=Methanobrevibacter arboriphilus TaxID=39441 RepID=A0ACA8R3N5_METAZ|nr:hypothetical protein [Methanobrevibacter arboriphilus]BBL62216.1 hypothetical protein MarbSA_12560 [Methanobrevibacter arboriphilus]
MHFIIISINDGSGIDNEIINDSYLSSNTAPSLIANNYVKINISNFIIYSYLYDQIIEEKEDYSFYFDENKLLLSNGFFTVNNEIKIDIQDVFHELNQESNFWGDYQLVNIDKNGNGFLKTPDFGLRQLFYYEDENFSVLSTEIKLIVDGIYNIQKQTFSENFDVDFIFDSIYNEWGNRKFPRHTIFKNIKRILPHDNIFFKEGKILIKKKSTIEIPKNFLNKFNHRQTGFYDKYYENLFNSVENSLKFLSPNISKIRLGLTGGFDSRITLSVLFKICNKQNISLECFTIGNNNHPDVFIAKMIVDKLNIDYSFNDTVESKSPLPQKISEYMATFYSSQGDWNSNNYKPFNRLIHDSKLFYCTGKDAYKKKNMNLIYSGNRWGSRRFLAGFNFFFPLFYTEKEAYLALLYNDTQSGYKEFVYEILKRAEPKLLEIPFVGDKLPQIDVEPYSTIYESKFHEMVPFFWDYDYVREKLKVPLQKYLNKKLGFKGKIILKLIGLNYLDFFLNPNIYKIVRKYRNNKISFKNTIKILKNEKERNLYSKKKELIEIVKYDKKKPIKTKMIILMDYASVADFNSFVEIEEYIDNKIS